MLIKKEISSEFKAWWKIKKDKSAATLQKFARGLMLPIAVLPFAGLLLGIGGAIGANDHTQAGIIFADIFKGMSQIIFSNFAIMFCIAVCITFTNESGAAAFMGVISYLVFSSSQLPFIHYTTGPDGTQVFHDIMWFHTESSLANIVTTNLGITSLQTSIFGGILIGGITAYVYNKFYLIKLPTAISFFSGVRFLPFIMIPASFLLAVIFVVLWPWVGQAINVIGEGIAKAPDGVDGLAYGIFTRALMPFGLHQIVIAVAFTTPFGGVLSYDTIVEAAKNAHMSLTDPSIQYVLNHLKDAKGNYANIYGDQTIWNFINGLPYNEMPINSGTGHVEIFQWFNNYAGIDAGRFTQDYPTYIGVCMGIGTAFILTTPKANRKNVISVIGSAMVVAFLTGITEPLEFTFLFVAPYLYYFIYVPLSGFSYMFMQLVGAHIGVGFARGFIDLIIYGVLPVMKGTRFYFVFPFAIGEGLLAFCLFYFAIRHWNMSTPGRNDNEVRLINKNDFKKLKNIGAKTNDKKNNEKPDDRLMEIIRGFGGTSNIASVTSCATRLRVTVKDESQIDVNCFKEQGASGQIVKGNNIQVIFGGEAVVLSAQINNVINAEKNPQLNT